MTGYRTTKRLYGWGNEDSRGFGAMWLRAGEIFFCKWRHRIGDGFVLGRNDKSGARALGCGSGCSRRGRAGVAPANGRSLHGLAGARLLWFGRSTPGIYTSGWLMAPFGLLAAMQVRGCCGSFGLGFEWAGNLGPGMGLFVRPFDHSGGVRRFVRRRWRWKCGCGYWLLLTDCRDWGWSITFEWSISSCDW